MNSIKLNIIVACDEERGIGKSNSIPWKVHCDMMFFRNRTIGKGKNAVIMGRNTYESIPSKFRPLKDRHNLVLSTSMDPDDVPCGVFVFSNMNKLLQYCTKMYYEKIWVIGGQSVYLDIIQNYSRFIDKIYITRISGVYNCDTIFPKIEDSFHFDHIINLQKDVNVHVYSN